jgi:hypothetical protein
MGKERPRGYEALRRQEARVIGKRVCAEFSRQTNWAVIELVHEAFVRHAKSPG